MLGKDANEIIDGERAVSYWVELDGVVVEIGSSSDSGEWSEDELG